MRLDSVLRNDGAFKRRFQLAFTLIELVAVMILIGILSAGFIGRFADENSRKLQTSRDDILAALQFAQQKAMDQTESVSVLTSGNTINVLVAGNPASFGSVTYPLILEVAVSSASFSFNRLGETTSSAITLTSGSDTAVVNVSAAGYAR
ncbi:type II secretion system protein [Simiduia curdlanivorans]|uniref:Tfp pilus assembly protein FimT/FimU n=1 Tax=Simiduia curdlanivorans TaxID=1492769 RepID=A0ABV8V226_9GAMM|nr:type II secretion system protein [Simiduia curdlanivorans]MDN3640176.1 type II secretion system protein [Simiduia curdlanivorans]